MVNTMTKKSYIWDIYIRVSHILLIVSMLGLYITSEFDTLLSLHVSFGVILLIVILFRVVYAFIGSQSARFSYFDFSLQNLKKYFLNIHQKTKQKSIGHNVASSYAIILILVFSILAVISGFVAYGMQENRGLLHFLNDDFFSHMRLSKEVHEFFANILLATIVVHILGALIDKFYHKSDAIDSMISGYKNVDANIPHNKWHKIYLFGLALSISLVFTYTKNDTNIITKTYNEKIDYQAQSQTFAKECGSCHFIYPTYLLPKQSWGIMMDTLANHFGTDASLDSEDENMIREYLYANSAEYSKKESAVYTLRTLKDKETIAITKTPYWKRKHKDVSEAKAKCTNCHTDIKDGTIEDNNIKGF